MGFWPVIHARFLLCVSRALHPSSFELVVFWRRQTFIRRGEERARDSERERQLESLRASTCESQSNSSLKCSSQKKLLHDSDETLSVTYYSCRLFEKLEVRF